MARSNLLWKHLYEQAAYKVHVARRMAFQGTFLELAFELEPDTMQVSWVTSDYLQVSRELEQVLFQ